MQSENITHEELIKLMDMLPTLSQVAQYFNVSEDTIQRRIRTWSDMSFTQFRDKYSLNTKMRLIKRALEMAENGCVPMMIFALKNLCNWTDAPKAEPATEKEVKFLFCHAPGDLSPEETELVNEYRAKMPAATMEEK